MSNQITRVELNKELRNFAIEDMQIAQDNGSIAIAQTLRGLVTLRVVGGESCPFLAYEVLSAWNVPLTGIMSEEETIEFLMSIYDVSDCEIID